MTDGRVPECHQPANKLVHNIKGDMHWQGHSGNCHWLLLGKGPVLLSLNWAATGNEMNAKVGFYPKDKKINMRRGRQTKQNKTQGISKENKLWYSSKNSLLKMKWWSKKRWVRASPTDDAWPRAPGDDQARTLRPRLGNECIELWGMGFWDVRCKLSLRGGTPDTMMSCSL